MNTTEPGPRRGRPVTRNRAALLETAMQAYWQDDRAAVSINALCQLAGVSKPSLYRDFGSEDGLTAAVLAHYAQSVLGPLEDLLSSPAALADKLDTLIRIASDDPGMAAGCLYAKMRATRSRFGPQTQRGLADLETHMLAVYTRLFRDSAARGNWRGHLDPALAAGYLHEQVGLAFSQRAAGVPSATVRAWLVLATSALV